MQSHIDLTDEEREKVDSVISLILRNRAIRMRFSQLREEQSVEDSLDKMAGEFHLSPRTIKSIVYGG